MGLLATLLAAAGGFATGAVWYMINGKRWMAATGRTEEDVKAGASPMPFIVAAGASLLTAGMMRHVFDSAGISGFSAGLTAGLGVGLFMTAPWIVTNYAFAGRPRTLWWIDAGHAALACGVIGAILGVFG